MSTPAEREKMLAEMTRAEKAELLHRAEIDAQIEANSGQLPESFLQVARSLNLKGPRDWSSRVDNCLDGKR